MCIYEALEPQHLHLQHLHSIYSTHQGSQQHMHRIARPLLRTTLSISPKAASRPLLSALPAAISISIATKPQHQPSQRTMSTTADALRPSKAYPANCHCGKIAYTATLSPPLEAQEAIACNCSICARNGYVLAFTPGSSVEFQKGEGLAKVCVLPSIRAPGCRGEHAACGRMCWDDRR